MPSIVTYRAFTWPHWSNSWVWFLLRPWSCSWKHWFSSSFGLKFKHSSFWRGSFWNNSIGSAAAIMLANTWQSCKFKAKNNITFKQRVVSAHLNGAVAMETAHMRTGHLWCFLCIALFSVKFSVMCGKYYAAQRFISIWISLFHVQGPPVENEPIGHLCSRLLSPIDTYSCHATSSYDRINREALLM